MWTRRINTSTTLGLITIAALISLLQWLYGMTTTTTVAVTMPVLTAAMITQAVNDLDNANTKHHILRDKHGWNKMFPDPNNNWEEIKAIIKLALLNGLPEEQEGVPGVVYYFYKVGEFIIEVRGRWIDGDFRIADAFIQS